MILALLVTLKANSYVPGTMVLMLQATVIGGIRVADLALAGSSCVGKPQNRIELSNRPSTASVAAAPRSHRLESVEDGVQKSYGCPWLIVMDGGPIREMLGGWLSRTDFEGSENHKKGIITA